MAGARARHADQRRALELLTADGEHVRADHAHDPGLPDKLMRRSTRSSRRSGRGETLSMLQFRHMGGALARKQPHAGARATLPGEVLMWRWA